MCDRPLPRPPFDTAVWPPVLKSCFRRLDSCVAFLTIAFTVSTESEAQKPTIRVCSPGTGVGGGGVSFRKWGGGEAEVPKRCLRKRYFKNELGQQQALLSLCSGEVCNLHPSCDLDGLPSFSYESPIASGFPGSRDSVYCGNSSRQLPRCRC